MSNSMKLIVTALVAIIRSACGANPSVTSNAGNASSSTPSVAEQACLRDVTQTTNNPDVVLLDSSFSEAGSEVIVGVGETRAPWRCIGYSDGTTTGIQSLSDEGKL